MSDRLNELRRQRALVQEQLAWLDREISRETATTPAQPHSPLVAVPRRRPDAPVVPVATPSAEEILARYQKTSRPMHEEAKRGCIIYFLAGMTLLMVGLGALMLIKYWRG